MDILLTGHRGKIGRALAAHLEHHGHAVTGFDLADGDDLLDLNAVMRAASGASAIVHAGAVAHDSLGTPEQIMSVNVLGTWHVLLAAEAVGAERVIHFSSAQALGIAEGERLPDRFPVDDRHPRRAMRPYGLSKHLAEDLCRAFTARTGIGSVSLRPVAVWEPDDYARIEAERRREPRFEWDPYWEYGAFVDIRDVVSAVVRALEVPLKGHHRMLLCAEEISGSAATLVLTDRLAPSVPISDRQRFVDDPSRALVDCGVAREVLGWRPRYGWSDRGATGMRREPLDSA